MTITMIIELGTSCSFPSHLPTPTPLL